MARETEIKLRIDDLTGLRAGLKRLGARPIFGGAGRVHERNILFDTSKRDLANREQLLRIRTEKAEHTSKKGDGKKGPRVRVTFKRPVERREHGKDRAAAMGSHKVREEIELEVSDARALTKVFEALGMHRWFRYEKFRTTFRLPASELWGKSLLIELDETPIGIFLELEGPPRAIDQAAKRLGFSKQDYIVTNYFQLYLEECRRSGKKPQDMLFQKEK